VYFSSLYSQFLSKSVFILLIQATVVYPEEDTVCRHSLTYTIAALWKIQCTSNLVPVCVEYTYGHLCRHIEGSPVLIHLPHTGISLAAVRLLCNLCYHPAVFFSTFVSLHFHFYKENFCVCFKNIVVLFIYLFFSFFCNCVV
jgi:hypothetical protein